MAPWPFWAARARWLTVVSTSVSTPRPSGAGLIMVGDGRGGRERCEDLRARVRRGGSRVGRSRACGERAAVARGSADRGGRDHDVFFGSRAIGTELSAWVWIAVAAFIVVGGCVLTVLWPRSDWSFNASAAEIIAEYVEPEPIEFPAGPTRSRAASSRGVRRKRPAAWIAVSCVSDRAFVLVVEVAAWVWWP